MEDSENHLSAPIPEKAVLSPDHPILEKFQQALKEHLLLQINRMKDDIFEIETETKKKNFEKEELGVRTYEAQQLVCNQQKILESIISDLQTVTGAKEEVENELEIQKKIHKDSIEKYNESEKNNRELQNEIESVNLLIKQMSQWENKIESHISVNKRVSEKTRKDNLMIGREKKEQDLLIYKLLTEIWKLESELETVNSKIRVKENEIEEMEQTVAVGNTNIEALQSEYRCLMHSWNSVVVAIGNRDKGLDCLNEELGKFQEKFKSMVSETEQIKKLTKTELQNNEKLTMIKSRVELDVRNCKIQTDDEMNKKVAIENEMYELQAIIDQNDKDIQTIGIENQQKQNALNILMKDFDKVASQKFDLEDALMKNLENQLANNKVANNLTKILSTIKYKKKEVEVLMNEAENKNSLLASETESQKFMNDENSRLLKEIQNQQAELEREADALDAEREKFELLFRKRERQVDVLTNKLEKATLKSTSATSPQELKTLELEKHIEDIQEIIKKLQSYWLREQKNILAVSNERQEQIHNLNMLKKQTLILEQKNLKISDEIEDYKKFQDKVLHNIRNLQNKGEALCETLCKSRNRKTDLDRSNTLLQSEYDSKLKDSELQLLELESEITEIEEDKVNLSKELIEVNREALEWEKKLQLAKEALNSMKQERTHGGEVDNMRQEIHRMEVIHGQLKKAQEKLLKDLEHCLSRRDSIYLTSEARQKRGASKVNEVRTRIDYSRKLDNMKNKMKQMENEIDKIKTDIQRTNNQKEITKKQIEEAKEKVKFTQKYSVDLVQGLEEAKSNRQFNFELLVMQQKKQEMYHYLSMGRKTYTIYKTEDKLVSEYGKQKDLNGRLCKVVENLRTDFPNYDHELNRINNTLKIGALLMYT
ncbi:lethal (2) 41Ab [Leptinotarsa decemlineata]|uniref:lethal (2) 41Ab n=1 Tax=Leptinotarsa decemlineata TaxID=7539 RepID=UPI003D30C0C0